MGRTRRMLLHCLLAMIGIAGCLVVSSAEASSAATRNDAAMAAAFTSSDHCDACHEDTSHTVAGSHCHQLQAALPHWMGLADFETRIAIKLRPARSPRLVQRGYRIDRPPRA